MNPKTLEAACLSCLYHDLHVAFDCINHHVLNSFNPYSVQFKDDLKLIADTIELLYKHIDSVVSHVSE